jgi:hypothetical protein
MISVRTCPRNPNLSRRGRANPHAALPPSLTECGRALAECSNAVRLQHPVCHHGGTLFANDTTKAVNCADCVCPEGSGWAGADCSLCSGVEACPAQNERAARACTWRSLIPNALERTAGKRLPHRLPPITRRHPLCLHHRLSLCPHCVSLTVSLITVSPSPAGKRYSCTCGLPGDVWSQYYCNLQPRTNFLLSLVTATNASASATTLQVDAYGGMPSQDLTRSDHYDYAVPGWWDSEFSSW